MKMLVLGIRHQTGIGKESGREYDMRPSLVVASPMESIERDKLKIRAVGFESMVVECAPEVFNELAKLPGQRFPVNLDLDVMSIKRGDLAVSFIAAVRQAA